MLLIAGLAIASFQMRLGDIQAPMGMEHWLPGHVLTTHSIWEEEGIANHHFSPIYTFRDSVNFGNRFLGGVKEKGRSYYVSYPPFVFQAPYFIFQTLGIPANWPNLAGFSFVLHLLTAVLLMMVINRLYQKSFARGIYLPALIAGACYLMACGNVHHFTFNYFSDVLVQPLLVLQLLFFLRWMDHPGKWALFALFVVTFLGVYTEYQAVFQSAVLFFLALIHQKQNRWKLPLLLTASGAFALGLAFLQFSSIAGPGKFTEALATRVAERTGVGERAAGFSWSDSRSWELIDNHFGEGYTVLLQTLLLVVAIGLILGFLAGVLRFTKQEKWSVLIIIIPILLHLVLLFNFNALHDFGWVKMGLPMCLLIGMFSAKAVAAGPELLGRWGWVTVLPLLLVLGLKIKPNAHGYRGMKDWAANPNLWAELSNQINETALPDDRVYVQHFNSFPVLYYYTKRNVWSTQHAEDVRRSMKWSPNERAVYFGIEHIVKVDTIAVIEGENYVSQP